MKKVFINGQEVEYKQHTEGEIWAKTPEGEWIHIVTIEDSQ